MGKFESGQTVPDPDQPVQLRELSLNPRYFNHTSLREIMISQIISAPELNTELILYAREGKVSLSSEHLTQIKCNADKEKQKAILDLLATAMLDAETVVFRQDPRL